jgi:hypothetical protein
MRVAHGVVHFDVALAIVEVGDYCGGELDAANNQEKIKKNNGIDPMSCNFVTML